MADSQEKDPHPPEDPALKKLALEEAARLLAEDDGPKLDTLGDVQRAMAKLCRRIRNGHADVKQANALTVALNTLHGMLRDRRDTLYQKRLRTLWEAHQKGQGLAPEDDAQEVQ